MPSAPHAGVDDRPYLQSRLSYWPWAALLWNLGFGLSCRALRVADGVWGPQHRADLWWIPKTSGVDVLFAVVIGIVVAGIVRVRVARAIPARLVVVVLHLALLFLGGASALAVHVSGSALTIQRLRGDDGATMRDVNLLDWGDLGPFLVFIAAWALLMPVSLRLARALLMSGREPLRRAVIVAVGGGCALGAVYFAVWDGRDRGYGRHPLGILVESAWQEVAAQPDVIAHFKAPPPSPEGFARILTPTSPTTPAPAPPTMSQATAKNVIVFFSEGIPLEHTSLNRRGADTTPRLRARADRNGVVLDRFYSPYHRSIHALYALLCGDFPNPEALGITLLNPRIDCGEWSTSFARAGVKPAFFHGGYFSFYDKAQFLSNRDYAVLEDAAMIGDTNTERSQWGIDDRLMVRRTLEWIDGLGPDERFAAVLVPISAHYPFDVPADIAKPFGDDRKIDRFRNAVSFIDVVFDELMTGLESRGLADETVVLFTADHGESPLEPPRFTNVDRAAYEYNVHVPAVLFGPQVFPKAEHNQRLISTPDILPTMLSLSGIEDSRPRQGHSFVATDWSERRVFLGAARSNVHLVGFLDGTRKYLLNTKTGASELYDLSHDPDELNNLADGATDLVTLRETALTWNTWQSERLKSAPVIDEPTDLQILFADAVDISVTDGAGVVSQCQRRDTRGRSCPGQREDFSPGIVRRRVALGKRDCFVINAPVAGETVVRLVDAPFFPRLSMIQFAVPFGKILPDFTSSLRLSVDGNAVPLEMGKPARSPRLPLPTPKHELVISYANPPPEHRDNPVCVFLSVSSWAPTAVDDDDEH